MSRGIVPVPQGVQGFIAENPVAPMIVDSKADDVTRARHSSAAARRLFFCRSR